MKTSSEIGRECYVLGVKHATDMAIDCEVFIADWGGNSEYTSAIRSAYLRAYARGVGDAESLRLLVIAMSEEGAT